jgi:hypothetical protein
LVVVGFKKHDNFFLILRAVLKDFFNKEVENIIRCIELLNLKNLLLGKRNQIMKGVLIPFEPYSLGDFLNALFVVNGGDLIQMHVLGPFFRLDWRTKGLI